MDAGTPENPPDGVAQNRKAKLMAWFHCRPGAMHCHRLGKIAVAVFDARMAGGEMKSLVGSPAIGGAGKYVVKRLVQGIKQLAREYAELLGDSPSRRRIEKLMAAESETIRKRQAAVGIGAGA
jgi:hypothetical protein